MLLFLSTPGVFASFPFHWELKPGSSLCVLSAIYGSEGKMYSGHIPRDTVYFFPFPSSSRPVSPLFLHSFPFSLRTIALFVPSIELIELCAQSRPLDRTIPPFPSPHLPSETIGNKHSTRRHNLPLQRVSPLLVVNMDIEHLPGLISFAAVYCSRSLSPYFSPRSCYL